MHRALFAEAARRTVAGQPSEEIRGGSRWPPAGLLTCSSHLWAATVSGPEPFGSQLNLDAGDASPVHVHGRDDEAFLLLDGEMTVWVGEERHRLSPGGIAFLPRGIPHAVRCDIASRALVLTTPAGPQETVFRAAGWDLSQPLPDGWQPTQDAVRRAAEQAGNTVLGPPHGLDD